MLLFLFVLSGKSGKGPSLFWRPRNPLKPSSTRNASGIEVGQPGSYVLEDVLAYHWLSIAFVLRHSCGWIRITHSGNLTLNSFIAAVWWRIGNRMFLTSCWSGSWTGTRKRCNAAAPIVYRALGVHVCSQPRSGGCDLLDDWSSYFTQNITVFVQKILYLLTTAVLEKNTCKN